MGLPTPAEKYAELMEHVRKAQEASAMLAHLEADNNKLISQGWMAVSEMFKLVGHKITNLAMGKLTLN